MKESEQIKALLNSQEGEIGNRAQLFIELSAATQKVAELERQVDWLCEKLAGTSLFYSAQDWKKLAEASA